MNEKLFWKGFIVLLIFIGISTLGLWYCNLIYHENAHVQINKYFGCSETHWEFSGLSAITKCDDSSNMSAENRRDAYFLHSINEIVGYNATSAIWAIIIGSIIISMTIILTKATL